MNLFNINLSELLLALIALILLVAILAFVLTYSLSDKKSDNKKDDFGPFISGNEVKDQVDEYFGFNEKPYFECRLPKEINREVI